MEICGSVGSYLHHHHLVRLFVSESDDDDEDEVTVCFFSTIEDMHMSECVDETAVFIKSLILTMIPVIVWINNHVFRSLWKLDLCTTILPQIDKLLQSKYER